MTTDPTISAILTASPDNPVEGTMSEDLTIKQNHPGTAYKTLRKMLAEHSAFLIPDLPTTKA